MELDTSTFHTILRVLNPLDMDMSRISSLIGRRSHYSTAAIGLGSRESLRQEIVDAGTIQPTFQVALVRVGLITVLPPGSLQRHSSSPLARNS